MAQNPYDQFEANPYDQFGSTPGGAATVNPNLRRQGDKMLRPDATYGEKLSAIGGAGAIGAGLGAVAPELMTGAAAVASGLPPPFSNMAGPLNIMAGATRAAGRPAGAILGGMSGLASETAGQVAEGAGMSQPAAEAIRFAAGGVGGETLNIAKNVLQKYALVPALGLASKFKHEGARVLLEKLNLGAKSLSHQEADYLNKLVTGIRGGEKTDAPLEAVGSIMGDEGKRLLSASELQMANAVRQQGAVGGPGGYPAANVEMADIGGNLRTTITKRNEAMLKQRGDQYKANEAGRDNIVAQRETSGNFVTTLPEYGSLVKELQSQLQPGVRSPSVQSGYQKILGELVVPDNKPLTFQALDDVRRKLGDAFRGKPAEGYDAISEVEAKRLYGVVSDIQKKYAGPAQARLLDDYASATPGLEVFSSKAGKKATALDQYRDEQFATDASTLPATYFKTRGSVQALKELTGNSGQVTAAALEFSNKELAGKDAQAVRTWMTKNGEWLSEVPATRSLVDKYASRLEASERSTRNAQDFVAEAKRDANMLTRKQLPAQRAVDLITKGNTELWETVGPVIAKSPQAKTQMVSAARQVIADQASSKGTIDLFGRSVRPFLEKFDIATKTEMDSIAQKLVDIQEKKLPAQIELGRIKRMILQSFGGYTASLGSRAAVGGYGLVSDMIPQ